jgi:hypothetical protein
VRGGQEVVWGKKLKFKETFNRFISYYGKVLAGTGDGRSLMPILFLHPEVFLVDILRNNFKT